jgi:hypothetical protein
LGKFLDGLAMEDDGIFYGHLVHFTVFCYILWTFGIVRGIMYGIFFPILVFCTKKNLATLPESPGENFLDLLTCRQISDNVLKSVEVNVFILQACAGPVQVVPVVIF